MLSQPKDLNFQAESSWVKSTKIDQSETTILKQHTLPTSTQPGTKGYKKNTSIIPLRKRHPFLTTQKTKVVVVLSASLSNQHHPHIHPKILQSYLLRFRVLAILFFVGGGGGSKKTFSKGGGGPLDVYRIPEKAHHLSIGMNQFSKRQRPGICFLANFSKRGLIWSMINSWMPIGSPWDDCIFTYVCIRFFMVHVDHVAKYIIDGCYGLSWWYSKNKHRDMLDVAPIFRFGDPYKPLFDTVTGRGPHTRDMMIN